MFRYMRLLGKTLGRKASIYIVAAIGAIVIFIVTYLTITSANNVWNEESKGTALLNIDTFTAFFPFIFGTLFMVFVIIHIFKQGELDGSELIIVAKPLTRKEILLSKFLLTFFMLLLYQFMMFIFYLLFSLIDNQTTSSVRVNWAASLFLGGIIIGLLTSSIAIMLTSVLGRIGTIVISLLITSIAPIVSFVIQPLGQAMGPSFSYFAKIQSPTFNINNYDQSQEQTGYEDLQELYIIDKDNPNNPNEYSEHESFNNYKNSSWYKWAAPVDLWYQWGRFYSLFTGSDLVIKGQSLMPPAKNFVEKDISIGDTDNAFKIGDQKFVYIYPRYENFNGGTKEQYEQEKAAFPGLVLAKAQKIIQIPHLVEALNAEYNIFNRFEIIRMKANENGLNVNTKEMAPVYQYLQENLAGLSNNNISFYPPEGSDLDLKQYNLQNANNVFVVEAKPFISDAIVITVWLLIIFLAIGGSIWIYAKRDFK